MKKWMACLLILAMMVCSSFAWAEGIDLAALSNDELQALMLQIQEEMVARHIVGTASLASGTYIVGQDIPAGSYVFTSLATGDDWGSVTIRTEKGDGEQLLWKVVGAPDEGEEPEAFFVTLNADDELKSGVPFSLTIYAGVVFN